MPGWALEGTLTTLRARHHAIWLVIAAIVTAALLILLDLAPIRTRPRRRP